MQVPPGAKVSSPSDWVASRSRYWTTVVRALRRVDEALERNAALFIGVVVGLAGCETTEATEATFIPAGREACRLVACK